MQLAVDVQIPDEFGGLNGEAIYIGIIRFFSHTKSRFHLHIYGIFLEPVDWCSSSIFM